MGEHDTHRGAMTRGMVVALCGMRFAPITIAFGRKALPGQPPDPGQICPDCQRADGKRPDGNRVRPSLTWQWYGHGKNPCGESTSGSNVGLVGTL